MKKQFLTLLLGCLAVMLGLFAQAQQFTAPQLKPVDKSQQIITTYGLTSTSAMLATDLYLNNKTLEQLKKDYSLLTVDGENYVHAYVEMADGMSFEKLNDFGVRVESTVGSMATALIPIARFLTLAQSRICTRIEVGKKAHLTMDEARVATHADQVQAGLGLDQAYDGTGVVVGIIDIGFEYCHPNFYDTTGTELRVKRVWDQTQDPSATLPSPDGFNYGREMTTPEQIQNARYSSNDESHATHVTGIAAGSGGNTTTGPQYKGMAPNADIVMVACNQEDVGIYDGITYIHQYAQSVGKPCVINMSLGSHIGPHDGTSSFDRMTLAYTNEHPGGLLLVGACGNEGGNRLHVMKSFSAEDTALYTFMNFTYSYYRYPGYADIWGSSGQDFQVGVAIYNTSTGQYSDTSNLYAALSTSTYTVQLSGDDISVQGYIYCNGYDSYNERPNMSLYLYKQSSSYWGSNEQVMLIVKGDTGTVHMWGTYADFRNEGVEGVTQGDSDYSTGEIGGSGEAMISVGSYVTRNVYTNISGRTTDYSDYYALGSLSGFSSHGPTVDGRVKPEITAPGQFIISSFNRFDGGNATTGNYSQATANENVNGNTEWWGVMQGTSMACPAVTGIMALWLQHNPNLTIAQAKELLRRTAITDSLTDTIPEGGSNLWGYGKINALGGVQTPVYTVTVGVNDTAFGTATGAGTYEEGTIITLTATPKEGYTFEGWSNGVTANPYILTVTSDTTINALFHLHTAGIGGADAETYGVAVEQGGVRVLGAEGQRLTIMDVLGRVIVDEAVVAGKRYAMPAAGVYVVKIGTAPVRKVVVR